MIPQYRALLEDLKRAHEKGRLAQGYLFFGEDIAGRRVASEMFANFLERGALTPPTRILSERALIAPDAGGTIGIDAIRRAKAFLWQTPQASRYRMLVIDSAHELSAEAEHALLKIAEEPPPHGLIIVQARDPEALLPTLRSRLQPLHAGNDRNFAAVSVEARAYAKLFLAARPGVRSQLIQELLDDDQGIVSLGKDARVRLFLSALMLELRPVESRSSSTGLRAAVRKNAPLLRLILQKNALMEHYNVNKRLQLEVINQAI